MHVRVTDMHVRSSDMHEFRNKARSWFRICQYVYILTMAICNKAGVNRGKGR